MLQLALLGPRAVINCITKRIAEGNDERLPFYRWTEVIDLARRKRWRTDAVFEARLAADGTVAGVTSTKPGQLAVIDTP